MAKQKAVAQPARAEAPESQKLPKVDARFIHAQNKAVINLNYKQERAKEHPLTAFHIFQTEDYPCILQHRHTRGEKRVLLQADRKEDSLCIPICFACLEELLYSLRVVNAINVSRVMNTNLRVTYHKQFRAREYCYFCGFSDGACYDVCLNRVRVHMCSHCRERTIIQLKKLLEKQNDKKST